MTRLILCSLLLAACATASASTDAAWKSLFAQTRAACIQASGLKTPKVALGPIQFSSAIAYRINGTWPQAHMKGRRGTVYCLHPYPDGKPEIAEAQ